jgi:hypothetical protein
LGSSVAEEENVAQELHGHLNQMLRTTMSAGLQMTEQRARRHQHEAEAERRIAADTARQLEERKRAEREANVLVAEQSMARQEEDRAAEARQAADKAIGSTTSHETAAFPQSIDEALAETRQSTADHTAKTCHQRERGTSRSTADLGR